MARLKLSLKNKSCPGWNYLWKKLSRLKLSLKKIVQVEIIFEKKLSRLKLSLKRIIQVEYEAEYERALVEVKDELRDKEVNWTWFNYSNKIIYNDDDESADIDDVESRREECKQNLGIL